MKRAECYIRGEESNAEKRSRDVKERGLNSKDGKGPGRRLQAGDFARRSHADDVERRQPQILLQLGCKAETNE
ncbi:hypothetical protein A2U01_0089846 [Trifolium medium]|uniref:Uncharacterized protein n=1 Tax=Trifolium medium TaxID=97028 RepID=A0A392UA30_9FABA|nr:hypothetical protein [Trifolium medium]